VERRHPGHAPLRCARPPARVLGRRRRLRAIRTGRDERPRRERRSFVIRTLLALLAVACSAAPALAQEPPTTLALGAAAPMRDTNMKGVDGKDHSIASVAGKKGTLVVFTCNSCPYAKGWQERVAAIGNQAVKAGFGVVAINANDPHRNPEDGFEEMVK